MIGPPFLCYTVGMSRPFRLALLFSSIFAAALGACGDDDSDRECFGDIAPHSLGPLEPCVQHSDQCVAGSFCADGYCTIPCDEPSDCPAYFELGGHDPDVFTPSCRGDPTRFDSDRPHGCHYSCSSLPCPEWLGENVTCTPGGSCHVASDFCGV